MMQNYTYKRSQDSKEYKNNTHHNNSLPKSFKQTVDKETYSDSINKTAARIKGEGILDVLSSFGIESEFINYHIGQSVTRLEYKLGPFANVNDVVKISDNIQAAISAKEINVEALVPEKGIIAIYYPNVEPVPSKKENAEKSLTDQIKKPEKTRKESLWDYFSFLPGLETEGGGYIKKEKRRNKRKIYSILFSIYTLVNLAISVLVFLSSKATSLDSILMLALTLLLVLSLIFFFIKRYKMHYILVLMFLLAFPISLIFGLIAPVGSYLNGLWKDIGSYMLLPFVISFVAMIAFGVIYIVIFTASDSKNYGAKRRYYKDSRGKWHWD